MADGRLLSRPQAGRIRGDGQQTRIERSRVPLEFLTEEQARVHVIVRRKGIETSQREVEEISGMDRWAGEVTPDGFQQVLIPDPDYCGFNGYRPRHFGCPIECRSTCAEERTDTNRWMQRVSEHAIRNAIIQFINPARLDLCSPEFKPAMIL